MLSFLRRQGRLLLLDDDPSMQRLIATLLTREGYRVDVVSEAAQATAQIARRKYAALLLDVMTPTEGGLTVIRHLRLTRFASALGRLRRRNNHPQAVSARGAHRHRRPRR